MAYELQGNNIADSAGTGAPNFPFGNKVGGVAAAGRYTPTVGSTTNVTSTTFGSAHYSRVANEVTVFGFVDIAQTGAGAIVVNFSLPIASVFAAGADAVGRNGHFNSGNFDGHIVANTSTGEVQLTYTAGGAGTLTVYYEFMYEVI